MDRLLNFRPEPFPELDHGDEGSESEFGPLADEWDGGEWDGNAWNGGEIEQERAGRARRRPPSRQTTRSPRKVPPPSLAKLSHSVRPPPLRPPAGLWKIASSTVVGIPFVPPLADSARPDSRGKDSAKSEGSGTPPAQDAKAEAGSERVRWVQGCLNRALDLDLVVDGIMSPQTRSALRLFQRQHGLPVTGLVGPDTEAALVAACAPATRRQREGLLARAELHEFDEFNPEADEAWLGETNPQVDRVRRAQEALNRILDLKLVPDGALGPRTRSAIRVFQARLGLVADGRLTPETERALQERSARSPTRQPVPQPVPLESLEARTLDWRRVADETRMAYVMSRLVEHYGFPEPGAAGLVGNFWSESGCIPNRIEGSQLKSPMTATDFAKRVRTFTAKEIMTRDEAHGSGPALAGVGLAQWTSAARRAGLFRHPYQGQTPGENILFNMDAQIDYAVSELRKSYPNVLRLLLSPRTTLEAACDEVTYRFEGPGSVWEWDPVTRKIISLRPRTHPEVQAVFRRRRGFAWQALQAYRKALV